MRILYSLGLAGSGTVPPDETREHGHGGMGAPPPPAMGIYDTRAGTRRTSGAVEGTSDVPPSAAHCHPTHQLGARAGVSSERRVLPTHGSASEISGGAICFAAR